tara:strand:- start:2163 stop:2957 length:795 start_codon:yes stop_codon:yes gene_type:complete
MSLTNKTIANTYKDVLQVDNSNNGASAIIKTVKSGNGVDTALRLSKEVVSVRPSTTETTTALRVQAYEGSTLLQVDSTNTEVKALGQYVNTGVHQFMYAAAHQYPDTANTWSALDAIGGGRFRNSNIELGTGSSPATTYDASANQADDLVQSIWVVPFNITIDAVKVWFGQGAGSGDTVKFSIMGYSIDTSMGGTGGDLSGGIEHCVSPSTITGTGYKIAYNQDLTISSANVNAGKAIVACVHQDGTNADLTVNMQLVYHLRST